MKIEVELENGVNWGFMLYFVCIVVFFFRSVFWKRGGDEFGSK